MSEVFLAVPLLLWFKPWQYSDKVGRRTEASAPSSPANQRAACTKSASATPHSWDTVFGA